MIEPPESGIFLGNKMGILKIKFDSLQIRFFTNTTIKEFLFKELEKVCAKNDVYNLCRYMLDGF